MKHLMMIASICSVLFSFSTAQNAVKEAFPALNSQFPSFTADNLNDVSITVPDKVTPRVEVIVLTFARQDLSQTDSWINTFNSLYKGNTNFAYSEVAVTGDLPVIGGLILSGIKGSLPKDKWDRFMIYKGDKEKLSKIFGADNVSLFYVYVTGKDGAIKWSVSAPDATDIIVAQMLEAVKKEVLQQKPLKTVKKNIK